MLIDDGSKVWFNSSANSEGLLERYGILPFATRESNCKMLVLTFDNRGAKARILHHAQPVIK